jgi:ABC-type multidrug transport system fused ATPase/permease subunit
MELRPNARRAKQAIILICAVLALDLISIISDYMQYNLLVGFNSGEFVAPEAATNNDLRQQIIAITYLVAFIVSAITFIRWFRRAYYNLETRVDYLTFNNNEVPWSWLIPFVSLFKPYQIMKEMFKKTEWYLGKNAKGYVPSFTFHNLGWWWTLWIVNNIAGQIAFRMAMSAETVDSMINSTTASMISDVIAIPLALMAILVIQDYAEKERLMENLPIDNDDNITETVTVDLLPES